MSQLPAATDQRFERQFKGRPCFICQGSKWIPSAFHVTRTRHEATQIRVEFVCGVCYAKYEITYQEMLNGDVAG